MCGSLGGLKTTDGESERAARGPIERGLVLFVSSGVLVNTTKTFLKVLKLIANKTSTW